MHHELMTAHLSMQKVLYASIRALGLTPGQPKVLEYLLNHDEAMQRDIAKGCCIEAATLTNLLSGMEKSGLIERKKDGSNRRCLYVSLTEQGLETAEKVKQIFAALDEQAMQGLSPEDRATFVKCLATVRSNMQEEQ